MVRKVRFAGAVFATESPPKAFRKMLQNDTLVLPAPARDGWAEFSQVQLAVLVLVRRLVEFGFSVQQASLTSCLVITGALAGEDRTEGSPLNAAEFLALLKNEYLIAYVDPDTQKPFTESRQSEGWPTLSAKHQQMTLLILPVGAVVARCFVRAPVMPDDDMTGSDQQLVDAMLKFQTEIFLDGVDKPPLVIPAVNSDENIAKRQTAASEKDKKKRVAV